MALVREWQMASLKYCICLTLLLNGAALAQDEVIVTASRQAEAAQDVAESISILGVDRLSINSAVHPAEGLNAVAGVNIHRGSGQEHLTAIRSPVLTGGAGAGSFLYLEDGVPLRAAGFANVNGLFESLPELSSGIEVFKGPGSVLYGSNAVHGLVNVISRAPEPGGSLKLLGSSEDFLSVTGSASTDSTRLSVSIDHDDGFRDDSGFDQQKIQLRHDGVLGAWSARSLISFQNLNQETAGFIQGSDAYKDDAIRFTNPNPEAFRDGRSLRAQVRLERPIGDETRLSLTPYARSVDLNFLRHFVPGQALETNGHDSLGLLGMIYGRDYIVGVDAEYTQGFLREFQDNPTRFSFVQGEHYNYEVASLVMATYARKDIALTDQTRLRIGARAEYTDYDYDNLISSGTFGRFKRVDDRRDDFFTVTPKISLTHKVSDAVSVYGRLARGSRAPQTSDLYSVQINQLPGDAKVETLDSAEVGVKGQIGGMSINLSGYAMKKDNFFFRNASGFNVTDGKTNHIGVETSFRGPLTRWLSVSGDVSYAQHTYAFDDPQTNPSNAIREGQDVDTAPRTLATFRVTARPFQKLMAELEWRHVGSYKTDPGNTQEYPGHNVFVLRSSYAITDTLILSGRIDNVFDVRYADRADFAFGNERYFPGRPRTLFLGLSSKF